MTREEYKNLAKDYFPSNFIENVRFQELLEAAEKYFAETQINYHTKFAEETFRRIKQLREEGFTDD